MSEFITRSSDSKPLVSVVIDSYNYARFLPAAIDSALNQSYSNVEVIVVDDGSTDDSKQVLESYGSRVKGIFKQNGGQASAINEGFRHARGEIVYFLDCDDVAAPDIIEKIVRLYMAQSDKNVAFQFKLNIVDKDGSATGGMMPDIEKLPGDEARRLLEEKGFYVFPPTSGNVFSRKILERIMPIPETDFRICADIYLCTMAGLVGTIVTMEETLGAFRLHGANNSSSIEMNAPYRIEDYLAMMIYEAGARKKSKEICENYFSRPIGGNSELLSVICNSAQQKLVKNDAWKIGKLSRFEMAKKFWNDLRQQARIAPARKKIPVMLYLAMIAFLPKKMVSQLVRMTFVDKPKPLDFLVKRAFSR